MALLRLTSAEEGDERKVVLAQYMEVAAPLNAVGKNVGRICVRWSTSEEVDHSVGSKKLRHGVVNASKWCGFEILLYMIEVAHFVKHNSAVHLPIAELSWFHHRVFVRINLILRA